MRSKLEQGPAIQPLGGNRNGGEAKPTGVVEMQGQDQPGGAGAQGHPGRWTFQEEEHSHNKQCRDNCIDPFLNLAP